MESKTTTAVALAALAALAQETRLAIFRLLIEHAPVGLPAGQIGERLGLAPATLSFHLKELAAAGLIAPRQDGRFIWYRADLPAMNALVGYLTENCCHANGSCVAECAPNATHRRVAVGPPARAMRAKSAKRRAA